MSATAITAAAMRAAHLHIFAGPQIHADTFALQLIGMASPEQLRASLERRSPPALRRISAYFALRHRFSEERLQAALDRGVAQVVLLGAGLDTFALRRPDVPATVLFIEVDHPASQQWKLSRIAALGLETPFVKYVPVDFALQDWRGELAAAGLSPGSATFFAWLGVSQYIPEEASYETFSFVARHAKGSEIVFDVIRPIEGLPPDEHAISEAARISSAERDEPWLSYFVPEELASRLALVGYTSVMRLTPAAAIPYYQGQPADVTPLTAWELMSARV